MRVLGWQTLVRNESNRWDSSGSQDSLDAPSTDRSLVEDLSQSISVRTRKMVNYAWTGRSQGKLWWRLVAVLTCKSIV